MAPAIWVWLALVVVFVIVELASVGLTSIWFAAGGIAAMFLAAIGSPLWEQIFVFFIVSIILLISTRSFAKNFINSRVVKTNIDSLIGKQTVITEQVCNFNQTGKTVLSGQEWTVRAVYDNEIFNEGELVEVVRVSGVKLIVQRIKKEV